MVAFCCWILLSELSTKGWSFDSSRRHSRNGLKNAIKIKVSGYLFALALGYLVKKLPLPIMRSGGMEPRAFG
jgi:hypothetical protein